MTSASNAFVAAATAVTMAAAVGYGLYWLTAPKGPPVNAGQLGRKWFAWTAMILTTSTLPRFFQSYSIDSFVNWIIGLVFFGGLALIFGWAYGRFSRFKSSRPDEPPNAQGAYESHKKASPEHVSSTRTHYANPQITENASDEVIKGGTEKDPEMPKDPRTEIPTIATSGRVPLAAAEASEVLWEKAAHELKTNRREGLWARCFAESDGNENRAMARYLCLRVGELQVGQNSLPQQHVVSHCSAEAVLPDLVSEETPISGEEPVKCPRCSHVVTIGSTICPNCLAMFGPQSIWNLVRNKTSGS